MNTVVIQMASRLVETKTNKIKLYTILKIWLPALTGLAFFAGP